MARALWSKSGCPVCSSRNVNDDVVNLLPGEQGDPLVASLANGVSIYANWPLPTYCMFTVRESDIVVSTVVITRRMIEEFRCADG